MEKKKTLRIKSDGTPWGTRVYTNGVEVEKVTNVSIDIGVDRTTKAVITVIVPEIIIEGEIQKAITTYSFKEKKCP